MTTPPSQPGPPESDQPGQSGQPANSGGGKGIGRRLLGLVVSVVVLIVVAVGFNLVTKWWNQRGMSDQVGSCVNVTGSSDSVDTEEIDCETSSFHYLVAAAVKSGESCPSGDYTTITTSQRNRGATTEVGSLCLMPKLTADTCYLEQSEGNELSEGECSDPKALFRVSKVLDEVATDQCELPEQALSYTEPARTYCLVAAQD